MIWLRTRGRAASPLFAPIHHWPLPACSYAVFRHGSSLTLLIGFNLRPHQKRFAIKRRKINYFVFARVSSDLRLTAAYEISKCKIAFFSALLETDVDFSRMSRRIVFTRHLARPPSGNSFVIKPPLLAPPSKHSAYDTIIIDSCIYICILVFFVSVELRVMLSRSLKTHLRKISCNRCAYTYPHGRTDEFRWAGKYLSSHKIVNTVRSSLKRT